MTKVFLEKPGTIGTNRWNTRKNGIFLGENFWRIARRSSELVNGRSWGWSVLGVVGPRGCHEFSQIFPHSSRIFSTVSELTHRLDANFPRFYTNLTQIFPDLTQAGPHFLRIIGGKALKIRVTDRTQNLTRIIPNFTQIFPEFSRQDFPGIF